jgi:CHAT domain-containing protein
MRILKQLLLPFLIGWLVILYSHIAYPVLGTEDLNQQAENHLKQGNALAAYQVSVKAYERSQNQQGMTQALINQGRAYVALGQPLNACHRLVEALKLEDSLCQTHGTLASQSLPSLDQQNLRGVELLGRVLVQLGHLDSAQEILSQATNQSLSPSLELSLANLERSLFLRYRNRYHASDSPASRMPALLSASRVGKVALDHYRQFIEGDYPAKIQFSARLNWLLLYADIDHWTRSESPDRIPDLVAVQSEVAPFVKSYSKSLLEADFELLPPIDQVYAQLKIAKSLLSLRQNTEDSDQLIRTAIRRANQLDNSRAKSLAYGTLAQLDLQQERTANAIENFEQARALALSLRASDLAYQWEWQLGRLYRDALQPQAAIARYADALQHQETVRANLFPANQEIQFAFADDVTPLYREYLGLLIAQPQPDLEKILAVHERLQISALETFLQCGRLDLLPLRNLQTHATLLYVLDVGDRIAQIIRSPDGHLHQFFPDSDRVRKSAQRLGQMLQDPRYYMIRPSSYLPDAQFLHQELIAPVQKAGILPKKGTLVLVTDDFMQNIPLGILHDGETFLIEHYSVATLFAGQIRQPKALSGNRIKSLVAGLSQRSPSQKEYPKFSDLPGIENEVNQISRSIKLESKLLNEAFTWAKFQSLLNRSEAPIIHLSTHGQFSSDPRQTFLLAWDRPITVQDIDQLFQQRLSVKHLPELLFLSACESAEGDKRSIFGMAGLAIQSGSASVIAPLWLIDANSTVTLVQKFYEFLGAGASRAEALQKAQVALLHTPEFSHPFYWAGFSLLGDWL